MKSILYRAKAINRNPNRTYRTDYENGDWVCGLVSKLYKYDDKYFAEMTNTDGVSGIDVDPETICEFTGLTDKNGKKIFEGDILSFTVFDYNDNDTQYKGIVKWSDTEKLATRFMIWHDNENEYYGNDGAFDFDWVHYQDSEIEVMGNIYDNIKSECDYITQRRLASFCELERAKQDEKKYAENLKRVEQTKQAYLNERDRLIAKFGDIDKIPPQEIMRLYSLQLEFLTAIRED